MDKVDLIQCPLGPTAKNLTGKVFGRLTVISHAGKNWRKNHCWNCKCECGAEVTTTGDSLNSGDTRSCGCLHKKIITSHGMTGTPEYYCWILMNQRCTNERNQRYARYGGRGISVCERWRESFENFYADMGKRPSKEHSIDRINNDGNYEPDNCRWATRKQQGRNQSTNRLLTHDGETLTITEWSERTGIPVATITGRLRSGWPVERALTLPSWFTSDWQRGTCNTPT